MLFSRLQRLKTNLNLNYRYLVTAGISSSKLPLQQDSLQELAKLHGNKTAIIDSIGTFSYIDILTLSCNLKKILQADHKNSVTGSRIAFLTPSNTAYTVCQWAIWLLGGIAVPLSPKHPPSEIQYVLQNAQSSMVLSTRVHKQMIEDVASKLGICHISLPQNFLLQEKDKNETKDLFIDKSLVEKSGLMLYTSGTTGRPKGVLHTYFGLNAQLRSLLKAWKFTSDDVVLHVLPLHHIHGIINLLMCPLAVGAVVVMENGFNQEKVWKHLLQKTKPRINVFMAVPTIYYKLLQYFEETNMNVMETREKCQNMRLMVSGSASLPLSVLEKWKDITGHTLLERYGMTETGMCLSNPYKGKRIPGAVGLPFPGVSVKVAPRDDDGNLDVNKYVVSATEDRVTVNQDAKEPLQGELLVKSATMFDCYWNNPEATDTSFVEGWFKTGDIVEYKDGVFRIVGRESVDILKSGGYKISALDIEQHLLCHSSINEVSVVGIPDQVWGQRIVALVSLKDDQPILEEDFQEWCRSRMPNYQIPKEFRFVKELPRNVMGKVNKKELVRHIVNSQKI